MKFGIIYEKLFEAYGDLKWWPAKTIDEVVIGAVLTQNTSWKNVERSLDNLESMDLLNLNKISGEDKITIINAIRPSGFYNRKSRTLKALASAIMEKYGGIDTLKRTPMSEISEFLSKIPGIGDETRDDIMLYALDLPVFIIDSYTRRIFSRVWGSPKFFDTRRVASETLTEFDGDVWHMKNLHAMLVQLAKDHCRTRPVCQNCPLETMCAFATD